MKKSRKSSAPVRQPSPPRSTASERGTLADVERLERRQDSLEGTLYWLMEARKASQRQAEKLRRLTAAVIKSRWQHRCSDRVGGCVAVSESKLTELREYMAKLKPFKAVRPVRVASRD
jgi:hypothetical protein